MTTPEVTSQVTSPAPEMAIEPTDEETVKSLTHVRNATELTDAIKTFSSKVLVIDFFATWCGPCRMIAPKLKEFQKSYPNVTILKVDVDEAEELAEKYDVSVVPTFVAIKNGTAVETLVGSDIEELENLFKKYN